MKQYRTLIRRSGSSLLFSFATLVSLGLADGQTIRQDVDPNVIKARVPSSAGGFRKNWEGFTTTNYLSSEQYLFTPPSAQMAAGPTHIITIVNRRIAIYDNPNAIISAVPGQIGVATKMPQVLSPTTYAPLSEALLDNWLGETILNNLCPTSSFSNISCLVDNATVRYDQMHGRFIVAMTVTDTGVETLLSNVTRPRKASWVVFISKTSTFTQVNTANPAAPNSDIFVSVAPPAQSTGGVNTTNWSVYYGNAVNGLGADGFGNVTATGPVGPGNINSVPGIFAVDPSQQDTFFGCGPGEIGNLQVLSPPNGRACYFPTSLRVGIDNDNIILTSAVLNVNYFIPNSPTPVAVHPFAGTRVRVLKKGGGNPGGQGAPFGGTVASPTGFYQKSLTQIGLTAGNQFVGGPVARSTGDYYDLYATTAVGGAPLAVAATNAGTKIISPFTLAPPLGGEAAGTAAFCEPARVRGRAQASYTNSMTIPVAGGAAITSQNYIECVVSTAVNNIVQNTIFIQPVVYRPSNVLNDLPNQNSTIVFFPELVGDGTTVGSLLPGLGMQRAAVDPFVDPTTVPQGNYLGTGDGPASTVPGPNFYVGDNRVHELVFREGHLYGARVGSTNFSTFQVNGNPLSATVLYDVIQALSAGGAGLQRNPVLLTKWNNTFAYAPMYDVPANVVTAGQAAPINLFPWLEKLFVATTYPQLTANDPRISEQIGAGTGVDAVKAACTSSNLMPNVIGGIQSNQAPNASVGRGYPGLYDMRCGMDVFDAVQNFRNPITGQLMTYNPARQWNTNAVDQTSRPIVPSLRGGASTDPNNGSLWAFGLYSNRRFAGVGNNGQLGSYIANYDLSFPNTDPYGNTTAFFNDCNSTLTCPFFVYVQTAAQLNLATRKPDGTVGLSDVITRAEMARLVVLSMMDEAAIAAYLNATGGCTTSFADVAPECAGGANTAAVTATAPAGASWRYIETMYRKRITVGCFANDAVRRFCPTDNLTRGQMAVFLIRAKFNNVYPSVISGCPTPQAPSCLGVVGGDNFGVAFGALKSYFSDIAGCVEVPATPPATGKVTDCKDANPYFPYIQKMYELRITNGTTPAPGIPTYSPNATLTRGEILTFIIRAFYL